MNLWVPPSADLGDHAAPTPDSRMHNFIGGLNEGGQPRPMTYQRLRAHTTTWPVTQATPEGPAALLRTAREMFAHGFFVYEFIASSCSWSIFAVEAAMKLRLDMHGNWKKLIQIAEGRGVLTAHAADVLDAGRQIRNRFVHEGKQPVWTFGMADEVIGSSHIFVAELYPDDLSSMSR